jgi:hypothetical protein
MAPAPSDTGILARYTVDAPAWEAFVRTVRAHPHVSQRALSDASAAGRTVVVTRDALQVGRERVELAHFRVHGVNEHGAWLQLVEVDTDNRALPLPLPSDDAALAAWLVEHFRTMAARNAAAYEEMSRQAEAERRRPTLSNRMLWFVERHFIVLVLVFFFVLLPALALLAARFLEPA